MKRTLSLHREALTVLGEDDLAGVAGAAPAPSGLTCPVLACAAGDPLPTWYCHTLPLC